MNFCFARCTFVALFLLLLVACGGGGGGSSSGAAGSGSDLPLTPLAGNFFPYSEGNRWGYQVLFSVNGTPQNAYLDFHKVIGTAATDGETTIMVENINPHNAFPISSRYLFREDGVYYSVGTNGEEGNSLGTYKIANLPLQLNDSFIQLDKAGLDFQEDLDGDGRNETLSITSFVKVIGLDDVDVPAGRFAGCPLLQTDITQILTFSGSGQRLVVTGVLKEWYAIDIGLVRRFLYMSGNGYSESEELALESYYVDGYSSEETLPVVVFAQPGGTVGGSTPTPISLQFSEDMDPTTLTTETFTLADSQGRSIPGQVTYADRSATFFPATPLGSGIYTATVSTGVEDLAGNALGADYNWSFTLDLGAPQVVATFPANQDGPVDNLVTLTATFSEAINPYSLNSSTFYLADADGNRIYGAVSLSDRTATFVPSRPLARGATFTATVSRSVKDVYGNQLAADYRWSFSVARGLFHPYMALPTGSWAEAVAIGDVNGDGRNDLAMTTSFYFDEDNDFKLFVFLQGVDGVLQPAVKYATGGTYVSPPKSLAIGDVNGDGRNDIAITNAGTAIEVFLQNPSGGLAPAARYPTADSAAVRIADFNGDGRKDVIGNGAAFSIFHQNPDGSLGPPVVESVSSDSYHDIEIGDVNHDGRSDVVAMRNQSYAPNIDIFLQLPAGGLSPPVSYSVLGTHFTNGVGVGDVNGDGFADVVVSGGGNVPSAGVSVFTQNSSGLLNQAVSHESYDIPESVEVADVNGDGRQDIVVLHGGWNAMGVYLQETDGKLRAEELYDIPYASHYNPYGLAIGDLDSDGLTDVAIADYNHDLVLLYNTGEAGIVPAAVSTSFPKAAPVTRLFKGVRLR